MHIVVTSIKQWESERIIRTPLLKPWLRVTYQQAHVHLKRHDEVNSHPFLTKSIAIKLPFKQYHSEVLCYWKPFGNKAPFLNLSRLQFCHLSFSSSMKYKFSFNLN